MAITLPWRKNPQKNDNGKRNLTSKGAQKKLRTVGQKFRPAVLFLLITALLLGGIGSRLGYLQLVQGERNRQLAEENRIRILPKPPIRGNILDRNGKILADSRLSYSLFIWPLAQTNPNWHQTVNRLSKILDLSVAEITKPVEEAPVTSPSLVRIARGLTPEQVTAIEEYNYQLNGVELEIEPIRDYPNGSVAAHVLGYTGEISQEELEKRQQEYRLGDIIGKTGAEAAFEKQLRGEWGGQQVEVNGAGNIIRILGEEPAQSGENITLTLDLELQKAAEAALGNQVGAIAALDPRTGEVLALASCPTFDPNIFSTRMNPEDWEQLQAKDQPFINRAIQGFPPASTFKIVTATAGMESGKFPPNTVLKTYPYLNVAGVRMWEWNRAGFGSIGYVEALKMSSNTFFGQIGRGVGGKTLIDWARRYGFGEETTLELPGEGGGLIADNAWKQKRYDRGWSVGDTVNMSIGQGFTLATPLQVAIMLAVPANKGDRIQPHLRKTAGDPGQWRVPLNLNPETVSTIRQGLKAVVDGGTGTAAKSPATPATAGKSGSAETSGKAHAWFGAFAPYKDPEIVVVAFAEHSGGGGGSVAAPIVREVMESYFQGK